MEHKNKLQDSGFESAFQKNWNVSYELGVEGAWAVDDVIKRSGGKSLRMKKTNSLGYMILSNLSAVRVEAGAICTFRFWFYSENAQLTSFLIPRLITDPEGPAVTNPHSALWVHYDYDSQSLMRNCPSSVPTDWVKRVVFYENNTDVPQNIFIQVALYGNPFEVWLDDFALEPGKRHGTKRPASPGYRYSEEQVWEILARRGEENAMVGRDQGNTCFSLNGKPSWPIMYRGLQRSDADGISINDPAGFAAQGVTVNNTVLHLADAWPGAYNWTNIQSCLMDTLRKNPHALLFLDFHVDPPLDWANIHPDQVWETKDGRKIRGISYSSVLWRTEGAEAIRELVSDLKRRGIWKIVVGVNIVGGHDWQFWTKALGEYAADYAPCHRRAWQAWLKARHGSISALNTLWGSNFQDFTDIPIPDSPTGHESEAPILVKGPLPDFRAFCEFTAFDLRHQFARSVKLEAEKQLFVSAYGMPMENQHECLLHTADGSLDMIASMSFYPYRQPGFASGYHPEQSFGFHNLGFIQELDLRAAYVSDMGWYDELAMMWCSGQEDIAAWRNMHRKLVGISLAQNQGFWYYDMDKQFVDPAILDEIGAVKRIADQLVSRRGVDFRPDVCLVRFGSESRYYGSSVDSSVGATVQWQYMQLETSGVPYDIHYLSDIMAHPVLQDYKIYIFCNCTLLSKAERTWINENLKKDQRTLIWLYDTGLLSDTDDQFSGADPRTSTQTQDMHASLLQSSLAEMEIVTSEGYGRSVTHVGGIDCLVGGELGFLPVPPFQGMAEALCGIFTKHGPAWLNGPLLTSWGYHAFPGVSRYRKFWVSGGFDSALARDVDDGAVMMAVKRFRDWTSIFIGTPNGLSAEMMHNIAHEAGAYRCGPPALGEMRLSGRFASYHGLRTGRYDFCLPPGISKVIDAETGEVMVENGSNFVFGSKAQATKWYFLE